MSDPEKTRLVHASRARMSGEVGTVNPPVVRCSTVLYRDMGTRKAVQARREKGERTFSYGANGTPTSFALEDAINEIDADRFVDSLRLLGIGASWGGYESLALTYATVHGWKGGALVRLHIGLEDPADIIADLSRGFAALG